MGLITHFNNKRNNININTMKKTILFFVLLFVSGYITAQDYMPVTGGTFTGEVTIVNSAKLLASRIDSYNNEEDAIRFLANLWPNNGQRDLGTDALRWNTLYIKNIFASDKVGIGVSDPTDQLQVSGTKSDEIFSLQRINSGNGNTFDFRISSSTNGENFLASRSLSIVAQEHAADIALLADPGKTEPQFVLKKSGKVGIGTASPDTNLHVLHSASGVTPGNVRGLFVENDGQSNSYFVFQTATKGGGKSFSITNAGKVGIGTTDPDAELAVKGKIHAQEVKVDLNGAVAPDFVFEADYNLRTLKETETYIKANGHLPEIPSAKEMEKNGVKLKEMNLKLLQKVEELTLYMINMNKQLMSQGQRIKELERENTLLRKKR